MVFAPAPSYSFTKPGRCTMLSTYFTSTRERLPVAASTSSKDPTKYSGSYWSCTIPRYRTREFGGSLPYTKMARGVQQPKTGTRGGRGGAAHSMPSSLSVSVCGVCGVRCVVCGVCDVLCVSPSKCTLVVRTSISIILRSSCTHTLNILRMQYCKLCYVVSTTS